MAQLARGSAAHVAATAVLIMVTISIMLIHCEADVAWTYGGSYQTQQVKKGGSITFSNAGNAHNAVLAPSGKCFGKGVPAKGPIKVAFPTAGTFYVICSVPRHCDQGKMKVKVIVTA